MFRTVLRSEVRMRILNKINKKMIIIISISVLTAAALLATAYLTMFSKQARQFYLEAEAKNFKKYSDQIKQIYGDFYSDQKPYIEGNYKKRVEVTADIKSEDTKIFGLSNAQGIFDIINKCKVVVDSKNNPAVNAGLTNISLLLEKAPLIDITVFKKDRQLGFTVPVVLPDKYFTLNLDKLDDVYDRFYKRYDLLPIKPKRVVSAVGMAKTIRFSNEELDSTAKNYGTFISALLEDKDVQYGKNVIIKIGNEVKKGREVAITLDSVKTKKLLQGIAEKMSNDDVLLKMTYENYADVIKMLDEAGLFQALKVFDEQGYLKINDTVKGLLNTLNIKKDIPGFKGALKKFLSDVDYPDGLKMTVVIDSSGNILDRKVTINASSNDNAGRVININTGTNDVKNDNFKTGICSIKLIDTLKDGNTYTREYSINSTIIPTGKNEKGGIVINYTGKKNDNLELSTQVNLDIDRNTDELTMKDNSTVKYVVRWAKDKNSSEGDKLSGELSSVSWKNNKLKTRNKNTTLTMNADLPSSGLKNTSLKLDFKKEDKFDIGEFQLPQLSNSNTIDLNNVTDKDLEKVEGEIEASFGTFYLKNKPIVDAVMGN